MDMKFIYFKSAWFYGLEFFFCSYLTKPHLYRNVDGDQRAAYGYTGWSLETAKENLWDQYTSGPMNSNPDKESSFMEV